ncbi:E3 SUMO-protein ligase KIAA1586-like [Andrena cerasifolii]|uniref:E3 SUMO-protein ligase KIAA1586-like n=1 Tax=Andrena cerasifolii TaxID=2819439 RepID=UPI00403776D3
MSKDSGIDIGVAGGSSIAIKNSDIDNESSSDSSFINPPGKKPKRQQAFCRAWMEEPEFKGWLQRAEDPYKGKCIVCCKTFVGCKNDLRKHAKSRMHRVNMQHRKEEGPIRKLEPIKSFMDSVKVAEIRFCIDIAEHNRSFNSFKQFIQMTHLAPADPNIVKRMSLKRHKISAIIQNVINKSVVLETTEILRGKFFSVLIDETRDISDTKLLWFLIRYVHKEQIYTYLLDLIRVKDCTAENLYKGFLHSLKKYNLTVSNIVGVCVDNANVMLGRQNSLISRLLADNEEISVFPCICHSMNLVTSHACRHLPSHIEEFLQSVCTYFSQSPKHQSVLEGAQDFMNFAKQKLQPSRTRWLALSECVKRVLNQWPVLFAVFAKAVTEGKSKVVSRIFRNFNCLYTKAYVQFLNYVLNIFIGFNRLFQSSKFLLHCLLPECLRLLRLLGGNFIKSKYITAPNIHKIDVYNEANLVPIQKIFIGAESMTTINQIINSNLEDEQIIEFYTNIKKFYQSAFENIVRRLPFNETFINSLDFLSPHVALDITKHRNDQLSCILSKFKSKFIRSDVLNEWHLLPFYFSNEETENLHVLSIPGFWHQIRNTNDISGEYIFENISKLAELCLSLPHSNADVERFFSIVTEIKTKQRNSLNLQTIAALTRIKLDLIDKNANSFDYEITDNMLNLFNNNMYRRECIPDELAGILLMDETDESDNETSDN